MSIGKSLADAIQVPSGTECSFNIDWAASTAPNNIINRPALATVATTGNYNDLTNKPDLTAISTSSGDYELLFNLHFRKTTATDATYYTKYEQEVQTARSNLTWYLNDGKDGASNHYQCTSGPITFIAYNQPPTGITNTVRYYQQFAAISLSGSFSIGGRGGNEGSIQAYLRRADTHANIATIINHDFRNAATVTTNGITASMRAITDIDGITTNYQTTISGTYIFSHSKVDYPLEIYLYVNTWRGTYGEPKNAGLFSISSWNHTL